jgi:predicted DNA-binding transcriptional regulator YafY
MLARHQGPDCAAVLARRRGLDPAAALARHHSPDCAAVPTRGERRGDRLALPTVNRTDRLYALVEELRAVAPRPRSARWLARHFEVSSRTIERDLAALQQSGVPIYAEPGRAGGYVLDRDRTLPPLAITPAEATALAVGLHTLAGTPFADAARGALQKVLAVLPAAARAETAREAGRIRMLTPAAPQLSRQLREALGTGRVLRIAYTDRAGVTSERVVEPLGFFGGDHWYLIAWCRLRDDVRGFRLDRVASAEVLDEPVPERRVDLDAVGAAGAELIGLDVIVNTDSTVSR